MRRDLAVLAAVLLVGYGAYGGLALAAGASQSLFGPDEPALPDPQFSDGNASGTAEPFEFEPVEAGFEYEYEPTGTGNMMMATNAGVYTADYDGDGRQDLLAVGGTDPVLFHNTGGSFEPSGALPPLDGQVRSATFMDYDADGDEDLLVLADGEAPQLLENVEGTYERRDAFERELPLAWGAATADFTGDGCLDVFVYQYGNWTEGLPLGFENYSVGLNSDNGNPDYLYRGTCGEAGATDAFERVEDAGIEGARWTLAASAVDLNGDGLPDIHQANDINHDVVYLNQGDGSFEQVALPERTNRNGMSSEVADLTGDGTLDVFVTNIYYPQWATREINAGLVLKARGNNLVTTLDGEEFVMRGEQFNVNRGGWGWAAVAADLDNDGDEDLIHATRNLSFERRDVQFTEAQLRALRSMPFYRYPAVFANQGVSFAQVSAAESGFLPTNGRGMARLDFDNDGDQDLAVATTDGYRLYENTADEHAAIQLRVLGADGGRASAYGATVEVSASGLENQTRRVHGRTDFLSQDSRVVHVGAADASRVTVTVTWPDGTTRTFADVATEQRLVVRPDAGVVDRLQLDGAD